MPMPLFRRAGRFQNPARQYPSRNRIALALALAGVASPALAAPPPMESVAAEIRSEVGGKLEGFYKRRAYWPLWVRDGRLGPEADRLIELIESADLDGLDPRDYDPDELRESVSEARGGSAEALAEAEVRLSRALADYVRDVRRPPSVKMVYLDEELVPVRPTREAVLRAADVAPSLADYLDNMGWASPFYAGLRTGLAEHRAQWAGLPSVDIPAGPTLRAGSSGDRVRLLRLRLGLPDGASFDKEVAAKLRAFQSAHGLPADALAGPMTIAALNRSPADYERTIRLNLERARALPSSRERHIVVDVAAARLWLYEDGEAKDTMRVIVGKPTEQTPMLAGMMRYAVVNPYWNVPPDLVARSIAPKVLDGRSLDAMGFEALSGWTRDARLLTPDEIDWTAVAAGAETLRVRQLPGRGNAMGRMKFMFPNDLGIYLHDTPDKALFKDDERRFSSGCVRVEDAPRLARWLFGEPIETKSDAPEQRVPLAQGVPVYLTYLTASPTADGIAFREDAYGRDGAGLQRLASR